MRGRTRGQKAGWLLFYSLMTFDFAALAVGFAVLMWDACLGFPTGGPFR